MTRYLFHSRRAKILSCFCNSRCEINRYGCDSDIQFVEKGTFGGECGRLFLPVSQRKKASPFEQRYSIAWFWNEDARKLSPFINSIRNLDSVVQEEEILRCKSKRALFLRGKITVNLSRGKRKVPKVKRRVMYVRYVHAQANKGVQKIVLPHIDSTWNIFFSSNSLSLDSLRFVSSSNHC